MSGPYVSHLQVEGEDPAGWYFGLYTLIGDWFTDEMVAQGIIRDTGKVTQDSWETEMPVFELLVSKNEIAYTCDGGCGRTELMDVGKVEDRYKQCSRCKMARYCSKDCQLSDWNSHKRDCRYLLAQDWQKLEARRTRASDADVRAQGGEVQTFEGGERIYTYPEGTR